jgi:hypothetical protein
MLVFVLIFVILLSDQTKVRKFTSEKLDVLSEGTEAFLEFGKYL